MESIHWDCSWNCENSEHYALVSATPHKEAGMKDPDNKPAFSLTKPRDTALSPALLSRVFHQPALVYFLAVTEYKSVREASRRLNIASSAVTRQIALLEDALGMALFHRASQRMSLTPAGEVLFRHARRLTAPMEAAVSELEMLRGLKTGTVRIAAVESVGLSFLPTLIGDFSRNYPRLTSTFRSCRPIR